MHGNMTWNVSLISTCEAVSLVAIFLIYHHDHCVKKQDKKTQYKIIIILSYLDGCGIVLLEYSCLY